MDSDCEKIQERIPELMTGILPAEDMAELRHHLSVCKACSNYYEALKADDKLLRDFTEDAQARVGRIEKNAIDAVTRQPWPRPIGSTQTWRNIYRSPIAKLAAAVIIIGMLSVVSHFAGSIDGSTRALAKTLERMRQSAWVYAVCETHSPRGRSVWHTWKSFEPHMNITKRQDGTIRYIDYSKEVEYLYNPNSNVVTVSFTTDSYLLPDPEGPFETISRIVESARDGNAKIARQMTSIDGAEAEVIHVIYNNDPQKESIVMVRDVERNLLTRMETKGTWRGTDKTFTSVTTFDYPKDGPKDIYALGVPREATIVDLRPEGSAMALVKLIQGRFDEGFGDHIAVVLQSWLEDDGSLEPSSISVFRRKGNLRRSDQYHAYSFQNREPKPGTLYEDIKDIWPDVTMPQILKVLDGKALWRQILFDGKQTITRHNDNLDREWKGHIAPVNSFKVSTEDSLAGLVWTCPYRQIIGGSSHMKRDIRLLAEDPNHPGLVGYQFLKFAQTDEYWFDPNKDHILIEYTSRQTGSRPLSRTIVTKTGRTADGRWYPKVIRWNSVSLDAGGKTRSQRWEKRVLLDTNPSFEEDIFNASSLTE